MSKTTHFVVEIAGHRIHGEGQQWHSLDEGETLPVQDFFLVSDFSVRPDLQKVQGEAKFAEHVLIKNLRDTGELIGSAQIIVHHKRSINQRNTELFFDAVPLETFERYLNLEQESGHHLLLFSFHMLLYRAIAIQSPGEPIAVILSYGRYIDLIVGTPRHIYGVRQMVAHSTDELQFPADVDLQALEEQLRAIERTAGIKIAQLYGYEWLQAAEKEVAGWITPLGLAMNVPGHAGEVVQVDLDGVHAQSSVIPLLNGLSARDAASPERDKNLYRAQQFLPWAAALLLLANVFAAAAGSFWKHAASKAEEQIVKLEDQIKVETPDVQPLEKVLAGDLNYQQSLKLVGEMDLARNTPSFAAILGQITSAVSAAGPIVLDKLELSYPDPQATGSGDTLIEVNVSGQVKQGRDLGMDVHNIFVNRLLSKGFRLNDSDIQSNDSTMQFALKLELDSHAK